MDAVATPEQTNTQTPDEHGSLSDHERAFHGTGSPEPVVDAPVQPEAPAASADSSGDAAASEAERDDKGRFTKPRHRAESQKASPDDVPRIRELTKRLREREAELESLRAGVSTRAPEAPKADPAPETKPAAFPKFDAWIAQHEGHDFDDYIDARAAWTYTSLREQERAEEQRTAAQRLEQQHQSAYAAQLTDDFYAEHPDFHEVVDKVRVSKVVERAVLEVGPRVAYYLAQHPEECEALSEETAIDPTNPAFAATVAATRRYLKTLVASEQRPSSSSSRQAAVSTGSAPARVPVSVPRPPNPVRTAALRDGDQPPGDESSLADHEKAYWTRRRA